MIQFIFNMVYFFTFRCHFRLDVLLGVHYFARECVAISLCFNSFFLDETKNSNKSAVPLLSIFSCAFRDFV